MLVLVVHPRLLSQSLPPSTDCSGFGWEPLLFSLHLLFLGEFTQSRGYESYL